MVLLAIVISSGARYFLFGSFLVKPELFVLERRRRLKVLFLLLELIFLLYVLNNIVILKFLLLYFVDLLESFLTDPKGWLSDDQVRILFLFFDHLCRNIVVSQVIGPWRRVLVHLVYPLPNAQRFEDRVRCLFIDNRTWVVWPWAWLLCHVVLLLVSALCWPELPPVASLDLVDQLVLHGVSWFIGTRPGDSPGYLTVDQSWKSSLLIPVLFYCFLVKLPGLHFLVVLSRAYIATLLLLLLKPPGWNPERTFMTVRLNTTLCNWIFAMNFIRTWPWGTLLDVLDWILIWIITVSHIGRWRGLLRQHPALILVLADFRLVYLLDYSLLITRNQGFYSRNETFSLIHWS